MSLYKVYDRQIAFHRSFVDFGAGVTGALMLSQAVYWASRTQNGSGWFYKTQQEWESETGLTRYEQEGARKKLLGIGVLQEKKIGVPCRLWFRADIELIHSMVSGNVSQYAENPQTGMWETSKQACGKPADIHTEITTKTTKHLCDEVFEKAWVAYPKRDGSNPKAAAQKCWNARLKEGVTVEEIMNGINRYRAYCAGKETIGTAFVMQAARFLGTNREYEAAWSAPAGLSSAPAGNGKRPRPTNLPEHKFAHPEWDNGVYEICTVGRHNPETGYLLPGQY